MSRDVYSAGQVVAFLLLFLSSTSFAYNCSHLNGEMEKLYDLHPMSKGKGDFFAWEELPFLEESIKILVVVNIRVI